MANQVGGCYYHEGRLAVATCSKCGVGLCRDCVRKDRGAIICPNCERELLRQGVRQQNQRLKADDQEYRQWLKERGGHFVEGKDFLIPAIIGLVIAGFFCGHYLYNYLTDLFYRWSIGEGYTPTVVEIILLTATLAAQMFVMFYLAFSIPFGYVTIRDIFPYRVLSSDTGASFILILTRFCFIAMGASIFGWAFFTFYWVRFLVRRRRAKKAQESPVQEVQVQGTDGQGPPTPTA